MQITRHTDYALRTLMFLAGLPPDTLGNVADIAQRYGISNNHLVKVVNRLGRLDYLATRRGRGGGIELKKAPRDIAIGQVVRDMETSLMPIQCGALGCPLVSACSLQGVLHDAVNAYLQVLDRYTLADVVADPGTAQNLQRLLQLERSD